MKDDDGRYRIVLSCHPFLMGSGRDMAVKPLEEAAEAYAAWQQMTKAAGEGSFGVEREDLAYECMDVVQAVCNLLYSCHFTNKEMRTAQEEVERQNTKMGRYE